MEPNGIVSIAPHKMNKPWEGAFGLHHFESSFIGTAIEKEHSGREMECSRVIFLYLPSVHSNTNAAN